MCSKILIQLDLTCVLFVRLDWTSVLCVSAFVCLLSSSQTGISNTLNETCYSIMTRQDMIFEHEKETDAAIKIQVNSNLFIFIVVEN